MVRPLVFCSVLWSGLVLAEDALNFDALLAGTTASTAAPAVAPNANLLDLSDLTSLLGGAGSNPLTDLLGGTRTDSLTSLLSGGAPNLGDLSSALSAIGNLNSGLASLTSGLSALSGTGAATSSNSAASVTGTGTGAKAVQSEVGAVPISSPTATTSTPVNANPSNANPLLAGLGDLSGLTHGLGDLSSLTSGLTDLSSLTDGLNDLNPLSDLSSLTSGLPDLTSMTNQLTALSNLAGLLTGSGTSGTSLSDVTSALNTLNTLSSLMNTAGSTNLSSLLLPATGATPSLTDSLSSLNGLSSVVDDFQSLGTSLLGTSTGANSLSPLAALAPDGNNAVLAGLVNAFVTNGYLNAAGQSAVKLSGMATEAYNYPDISNCLNGMTPCLDTTSGEMTPAVQTALSQMGIRARRPEDLVTYALSKGLGRRLSEGKSVKDALADFDVALKNAFEAQHADSRRLQSWDGYDQNSFGVGYRNNGASMGGMMERGRMMDRPPMMSGDFDRPMMGGAYDRTIGGRGSMPPPPRGNGFFERGRMGSQGTSGERRFHHEGEAFGVRVNPIFPDGMDIQMRGPYPEGLDIQMKAPLGTLMINNDMGGRFPPPPPMGSPMRGQDTPPPPNSDTRGGVTGQTAYAQQASMISPPTSADVKAVMGMEASILNSEQNSKDTLPRGPTPLGTRDVKFPITAGEAALIGMGMGGQNVMMEGPAGMMGGAGRGGRQPVSKSSATVMEAGDKLSLSAGEPQVMDAPRDASAQNRMGVLGSSASREHHPHLRHQSNSESDPDMVPANSQFPELARLAADAAGNKFPQSFDGPDSDAFSGSMMGRDRMNEDSSRYGERFYGSNNGYSSYGNMMGGGPMIGGMMGERPMMGGMMGERPMMGGMMGERPMMGGMMGERPMMGGMEYESRRRHLSPKEVQLSESAKKVIAVMAKLEEEQKASAKKRRLSNWLESSYNKLVGSLTDTHPTWKEDMQSAADSLANALQEVVGELKNGDLPDRLETFWQDYKGNITQLSDPNTKKTEKNSSKDSDSDIEATSDTNEPSNHDAETASSRLHRRLQEISEILSTYWPEEAAHMSANGYDNKYDLQQVGNPLISSLTNPLMGGLNSLTSPLLNTFGGLGGQNPVPGLGVQNPLPGLGVQNPMTGGLNLGNGGLSNLANSLSSSLGSFMTPQAGALNVAGITGALQGLGFRRMLEAAAEGAVPIPADLSDNLGQIAQINPISAALSSDDLAMLSGLTAPTNGVDLSGLDLSTLTQHLQGLDLSGLNHELHGVDLSSLGNLANNVDLSELTQSLANNVNLGGLAQELQGMNLSSLTNLPGNLDLGSLTHQLGNIDISHLAGLANLPNVGSLTNGLDVTKLTAQLQGMDLSNLTNVAQDLDLSSLTQQLKPLDLTGLSDLAKNFDLSTLSNFAQHNRTINAATQLQSVDTDILSGVAQNTDLSPLSQQLSSLSTLPSLSALGSLGNLNALGGLGDLSSGLSGLGNLGDLSSLASLAGLGDLSSLSNLTSLPSGLDASSLASNATSALTPGLSLDGLTAGLIATSNNTSAGAMGNSAATNMTSGLADLSSSLANLNNLGNLSNPLIGSGTTLDNLTGQGLTSGSLFNYGNIEVINNYLKSLGLAGASPATTSPTISSVELPPAIAASNGASDLSSLLNGLGLSTPGTITDTKAEADLQSVGSAATAISGTVASDAEKKDLTEVDVNAIATALGGSSLNLTHLASELANSPFDLNEIARTVTGSKIDFNKLMDDLVATNVDLNAVMSTLESVDLNNVLKTLGSSNVNLTELASAFLVQGADIDIGSLLTNPNITALLADPEISSLIAGFMTLPTASPPADKGLQSVTDLLTALGSQMPNLSAANSTALNEQVTQLTGLLSSLMNHQVGSVTSAATQRRMLQAANVDAQSAMAMRDFYGQQVLTSAGEDRAFSTDDTTAPKPVDLDVDVEVDFKEDSANGMYTATSDDLGLEWDFTARTAMIPPVMACWEVDDLSESEDDWPSFVVQSAQLELTSKKDHKVLNAIDLVYTDAENLFRYYTPNWNKSQVVQRRHNHGCTWVPMCVLQEAINRVTSTEDAVGARVVVNAQKVPPTKQITVPKAHLIIRGVAAKGAWTSVDDEDEATTDDLLLKPVAYIKANFTGSPLFAFELPKPSTRSAATPMASGGDANSMVSGYAVIASADSQGLIWEFTEDDWNWIPQRARNAYSRILDQVAHFDTNYTGSGDIAADEGSEDQDYEATAIAMFNAKRDLPMRVPHFTFTPRIMLQATSTYETGREGSVIQRCLPMTAAQATSSLMGGSDPLSAAVLDLLYASAGARLTSIEMKTYLEAAPVQAVVSSQDGQHTFDLPESLMKDYRDAKWTVNVSLSPLQPTFLTGSSIPSCSGPECNLYSDGFF